MWKVATILLMAIVMVTLGYISFGLTLVFWEGKPDGSQSCYGLRSLAVGLFGFLAPAVVVWYSQKRQFTVRALLIGTAGIALVLGIFAMWIC